ncbi:MAG: hypothetical protein NTU61_03840 [Candidatus Altiarchaeota archaeon]|nr:hypothetical protein [Candidatus Altiarchaeota archaeon]
MAGLSSSGRRVSEGWDNLTRLLMHYKVALIILFLMFVFVSFVVGGGLIYSLLAGKVIDIPESTTTTLAGASTTTSSTLSPSTTTVTTTSSTTFTTSTTATTSTTESTTTTLTEYQIKACVANKIQRLYMRNDSTCFQCRSIRNYFGSVIDSVNIVDCESNRESCDDELNQYKDDDMLKTPGGSDASRGGYPTAVIGGVAYVGVNGKTLEDLSGCVL